MTNERKRFSSYLDIERLKELDLVSEKTRVPKTKLLDEAIKDLAKKYDIKK